MILNVVDEDRKDVLFLRTSNLISYNRDNIFCDITFDIILKVVRIIVSHRL